MGPIAKIKLFNFKKFDELEINFNDTLNMLIGDNEAGKSSILTALDIVLSGSRSKVESIGLDNLFNTKIVDEFLNSNKDYESLPTLKVEIYLNEQNNPDLNGNANSDSRITDGLSLTCRPNDDFSKEIKEVLSSSEQNFPFEYYSIVFKTFSDENFTNYRKFFNHILIDNTLVSNEYAVKEYVKSIYRNNVTEAEKNKHHNLYRQHKNNFNNNILKELNDRTDNYDFTVRTNSKSNLETDLTISEDNIYIENKGKGRQCFIKAEFALRKNNEKRKLDILLIEEPENHLSHINMKKLISKIRGSEEKQIIIATHNSLISTRLDLRKSILLNSNSSTPVALSRLNEDTAKFFMKAPDNNILEMVLSKKILLVEGDAEFILMEALFYKVTGEKFENSDIHTISVDGTSFKRYLELSKILNIKTAVIRDNDGDYKTNCEDPYSEYINDLIQVFSEKDNQLNTFEKSIYRNNKEICDELFSEGLKKLTVEDHMLKNKTKVAFELLDKKSLELVAPDYIKEAIEWIRK